MIKKKRMHQLLIHNKQFKPFLSKKNHWKKRLPMKNMNLNNISNNRQNYIRKKKRKERTFSKIKTEKSLKLMKVKIYKILRWWQRSRISNWRRKIKNLKIIKRRIRKKTFSIKIMMSKQLNLKFKVNQLTKMIRLRNKN